MGSLTLNNIHKSFGAVEVLSDINLEVEEGEFVIFVGPSGCGKSTLLRIIAGLEDATSGDVFIGDYRVNTLPPSDRGIAMVFQTYALYPHLTVRKNMSLGLKQAKQSTEYITERVGIAADMLELTPYLERRPAELSGGQRQRVAIGRALVKNVDVFLFDEPLSNLDAKLRTEMRLEIKKLHNELKKTIVFVTHDQVEAMTMATRIAIMDGGVVQQIGTPDEVYETPANLFVAKFIGAPPMNILAAEIKVSGGKTFAHHSASNTDIDITSYQFTTAPKDGARVYVGMRPEHFLVGDAITDSIADFELPVQYSEKTGSDGTAYLATGDEQLAIRVAPELVKTLSQGDMLKLGFPADKLSVFDATTELRI